MQVIYFLQLLLLSSIHRVSADYEAFGRYHPKLVQHAKNKGVWDNEEELPADVNANNFGFQGNFRGESIEKSKKEFDPKFDDGELPQEIPARTNVKPQGTHSETYGELTNISQSNVTMPSPHLIAARSTNQCKFPTDLKESQLDCTTYPSKVVCIQTCIFGYTLEEQDGIKRRMECNNVENRWRPVPEFEKCKPFVDCGVTVGPGGSYKCRKNYMHKGPDCDIACSAYEDKESVPTARYECDISGKWTPQLPFCAKGGSGLKLVPVPHGPKQISDLK